MLDGFARDSRSGQFARDSRSGQMESQFVVVVKMCECFGAIAECRKAIIATGQRPFLDAKFCHALDQLFA
jgi:hypothetical protein